MNASHKISCNKATRKITAILGIFLAISGFNHGFFEALQGFTPTGSYIIQAIGEDIRWWIHGSEEAFTLIPNFLLTGMAAMLVSVCIVIWSLKYLHTRRGPAVFLLLFILLTLVGGGIGFIPIYLTVWAYGTRMHKPLTFWKKIFSEKGLNSISVIWPYSLFLSCLLLMLALEIAIFGYWPGNLDADTLLYVCWTFLGISYMAIHVAFISGFADDIKQKSANLSSTQQNG